MAQPIHPAVDVVIVGAGPAGASAALTLGRARKRVLVCDDGPRRNAAAEHIHNFVTRDGTPPNEFRRIAQQQLAHYPSVALRAERVAAVAGQRGGFLVTLGSGAVNARRILLCTGMIDQMLPIDGFRELWGKSIFQCPYCHGWEVQDRPWGYLARADDAAHLVPFALMARSWTERLVVFTGGAFEVAEGDRARLAGAGIRLETAPVARLVAQGERLAAVELATGLRVACEVLFAQPPQRHVELVDALGLGLDEAGYVRVDAMTCETSLAGVYAAGDLTTRMQGAVLAAAMGSRAAAMINLELSLDGDVR